MDESDIEIKSCCRRFRMGDTTYLSEIDIRFPIVLKTDEGEYIKRRVTAYIIEAERVNFLLGKESIMDLDIMLDCPRHRIVFNEKGKKIETLESSSGHMVVNLEFAEECKNNEAIYLVEKEDDVKSEKAIKRIHKNINHKSKE